MNNSLIALGMAAVIVIAGSMGHNNGCSAISKIEKNPHSEKKSAKSTKNKELIYVSAEQATFNERMPGVSMAVLWGDPDKGAHGTFTKFAPGYDAGTHTHTSDVWLVVLKGAYLYKDDAGEKRVGRESSSGFRAGTSIGAAATRRKARSFTRKARGNSTRYPLSREERRG